MPFAAKRSFDIVPLPTEGGVSQFKITRGMLEAGLVVSAFYSVNVTTAGTIVRARSLPIRRIQLFDDNGAALQTWYARDLITFAQLFEQTPPGALLVPPGAAGIANYTALEAHCPLFFEQPRANGKGDATALPTFGYKDLTLRVEWGTVVDLLTGTPVGPITFTSATVTQLDYADVRINAAQALNLVRTMPVAIGRYIEVTQAAVATPALSLDLGTTEDIRAIIITSELVATGEPTTTAINTVTLRENNTNPVHSNVPYATLRADNAKYFGIGMPAGVAVFDFADDGDIFNIYRASTKTKVELVLNTPAVNATHRAALVNIRPPRMA